MTAGPVSETTRAMKPLLLTVFLALALCACAPFKAKKHHTAAIAAPSVGPVKDSIGRASAASMETSRHISDIKRGTDRVDYKGGRALNFFLD